MATERVPEIPQTHSEPETLSALQDSLLGTWQQIPTEHQAGMVLVLLEKVMGTEAGTELRKAIETRWPKELETLGEHYPVARISRAHLQDLQLSEDELSQLGDNDLRKIARKMEGYYLIGEFWDDLDFAAHQVLKEKQDKNSENPTLADDA